MAMTNSDKLHVEPTPVGWTAYYDPEGLHGDGATQHQAVVELLEQTDEAWRKSLDERDAAKRSFSEEQQKNAELVRSRTDAIMEANTLTERLAELTMNTARKRIESDAYAEELKALLKPFAETTLPEEVIPGSTYPNVKVALPVAEIKAIRAALSKNTVTEGGPKAAGANTDPPCESLGVGNDVLATDTEDRITRDRRDAERYRFLRAEHDVLKPVMRVSVKMFRVRDSGNWGNVADGPELDKIIDEEAGKADGGAKYSAVPSQGSQR